MKYSNEYKVHYYYTDYNNILKPSYAARYMQETAWYELKNQGPTPEELKEKNQAFILTKISFRYYEEIFEDDIIRVETWANPPKGLIFPRNYRIYKNNGTAAEAVSAWVLLDLKEKNILRSDTIDVEENFLRYDDEKLDFDVQKRIKMPENMNVSGEYKVKYSDIDTYFHMNNVAYIDLICDSLYTDEDIVSPDISSKKKILSLDLNYNGEARFAQIIEMKKSAALCGETRNQESFIQGRIKNSGQNCFDAKVVLTHTS